MIKIDNMNQISIISKRKNVFYVRITRASYVSHKISSGTYDVIYVLYGSTIPIYTFNVIY